MLATENSIRCVVRHLARLKLLLCAYDVLLRNPRYLCAGVLRSKFANSLTKFMHPKSDAIML